MEVDAVVLDIDGVLVDVADSYRRAIVESVESVYGDTIPKPAIQAFKDAGGFNNDWELTDAAALYVLGREAGYEESVEAFTDAIAARGGGLDAAEGAMAEASPGDEVTVSVTLEFDHDGASYRATRSAVYEKRSATDFDGQLVDEATNRMAKAIVATARAPTLTRASAGRS